ncbi:MAG TPA: MFS transporter [Pseudomonas sp.]|nr:MFS transporter [Pseudomonas sp.]
MAALLILAGLLLMLAGMVWLVTLAFGTSLFWGIGSLMPPFTLAYLFAHWSVARRAVLTVGLGIIPLVVGLSMLAARAPEKLDAILALEWLPQPEAAQPGGLLHGQLNGQAFRPEHGELIDGVLSLRSGSGFYANQEVRIELREPPADALRLDVLPDDEGPLPTVRIAWLEPGRDLPESRVIQHGYTLHLVLAEQAPNRLVGRFHLVLPPQYATSLSGEVELYTDRLRYRDGQVDRTVDSTDTIAYVLEDYLQRRHASHDVTLTSPLGQLPLAEHAFSLPVEARVDGVPTHLQLALSKGAEGWSVEDDAYPPLPPAVEQPVEAREPAPVRTPPVRSHDRRKRFSMARLLREPATYDNMLVRAHTERGGVAEGRFAGLDAEGRLRIRRMLGGPGEAYFNLAPGEIVLLEALEP